MITNTYTLAYWKGKKLDARSALKNNIGSVNERIYRMAVRFAAKKVQMIENIVLLKGRV